jgi:hypothetical protein
MLRRISVVLISALLMMGFTTSVAWADQPPNKGQAGSDEIKSTGQPVDANGDSTANGFGAVTSQRATSDLGGDVGEHASGFAPGQDDDAEPAQRLGVGNVARNDGFLLALPGNEDEENTGTRPGDHAELIYNLDGNDCTDTDLHPGNHC